MESIFTSDKEDDQDDVREGGRDVDHFAGRCDPYPTRRNRRYEPKWKDDRLLPLAMHR